MTAMIMFMVLGGNVFAFMLSTLGIPQYLTDLIVGLDVSPWVVMIVINVVFLILGCLLDPMSIMVICLPILFPIVTKLGFDPVWFGIIITINMEMGMITPPFGLNLFILKATLRDYTSMEDIVRGLSAHSCSSSWWGLPSSWSSRAWPPGSRGGWGSEGMRNGMKAMNDGIKQK